VEEREEEWKGKGRARGREWKEGEGENDLTHPLSKIPGYATVLRDSEIWIAFGHGAEQRYIPCHVIAAELGKDASWGLLYFTRCQDVIRFLPSIIP